MSSPTDKIVDFAIGNLQHLLDTAVRTLPAATKILLEVTSFNCTLAVVELWAVTAIVAVFWGLWAKFGKRDGNESRISYEFGAWGFKTTIIFAALCLATCGVIIAHLCSPWWYVGIFHPDLYLINSAINSVK